MKKLIIILFFKPLFASAQCSEWIGQPVDSSLQILSLMQQYGNNSLQLDSSRTDQLMYQDEDKKYLFIVRTNTENKVRNIFISAPADLINNLLQFYFKPRIESCITASTGTYYFWSKYKIVFASSTRRKGVDYKTIEIEKQ